MILRLQLSYGLLQAMPIFRTLKRDNTSVNIGHPPMLSMSVRLFRDSYINRGTMPTLAYQSNPRRSDMKQCKRNPARAKAARGVFTSSSVLWDGVIIHYLMSIPLESIRWRFPTYRDEAWVSSPCVAKTPTPVCRISHRSTPSNRFSPGANRVSKARLNAAAAAPLLSITIKFVVLALEPDAEKFAAPLRSNCPSIW